MEAPKNFPEFFFHLEKETLEIFNEGPKPLTSYLLRMIDSLEKGEPALKDEDRNFCLGYSWFQMPEDPDLALTRGVEYFQKALKINPKHSWALTFLAECFFEDDQFEEVVKLYTQIDEDYFEKNFEEGFRDLKRKEIKLSSELYLWQSVKWPEVERFFEVYAQATEENKTIPQEMLYCLEDILEEGEKLIPRKIINMVQALLNSNHIIEDVLGPLELIRKNSN